MIKANNVRFFLVVVIVTFLLLTVHLSQIFPFLLASNAFEENRSDSPERSYHQVFAPKPGVRRLPLAQEVRLNVTIAKADIRAGTWKRSYKYFFTDGQYSYIFKKRDPSTDPDANKMMASEVISSRLAVLLGLRDDVVYEHAFWADEQQLEGTLQHFHHDFRPFQVDDFRQFTPDDSIRLLEEYVFDVWIANRDTDLHNTIIHQKDPQRFLIVDRDQGEIFWGEDFSGMGSRNTVTTGYLYRNFWSLVVSGLIRIDTEAGFTFARHIQGCPDQIIIDTVSPLLKRYRLPDHILESLLDRKKSIVDVFERNLKQDMARAKKIDRYEDLVAW